MSIETLLQAALAVASVGLAGFCLVLARRLRRLNDLETGLGGAIAVMAAEVDRLERAIVAARSEATDASERLVADIARARKERAMWDLRQRIDAAATPQTRPVPARRLRKRAVNADA
ncbi:hypothetical protein JHW45_02030 [Paracoccus stylophorae]|uniref:Uncharacterized protein n=1 Tax=Paracoccus stylophorae TaxID=659350 RepID=A0ABY7SWI4_9RHOB|nr:hypothetical protein [Paracoccus stylophorae]WCR11209.1 hypothetical protein JHW45_02030 [Paracoccus stylophorae]